MSKLSLEKEDRRPSPLKPPASQVAELDCACGIGCEHFLSALPSLLLGTEFWNL